MDDTQRNRLRMYKATHSFLILNEEVWNMFTGYVSAVAALGIRNQAIDLKVQAQEAELAGFTELKRQRRTALKTATLLVAGPAEAYARATNDPLLLAKVDLVDSDLENASDQRVDDIAQRVATAAADVLPSLALYGITATEMTALTDAITDFDGAKSLADAMRAMRKGHTQTLEPMFKETTEFLDGQLDTLMRRYKTENPTFHAGYEAARVIIDLRGPGGDEEEEPEPDPGP